MIDPRMLVEQSQTAGLPAPVWFVQFFKALGFTLHAVPMNLWYAGLLVALCLRLRQNQNGRQFASRLAQQMPIIVAMGINLGIVPLLFIQLAYSMFFYPATILMAWFWLGIVVLLIPAYYSVYLYAWRFADGRDQPSGWRTAAGWCAAIFFVAIGFTFANGLSLSGDVGRWSGLWAANNAAGAAVGTAMNLGDPSLWPRWLLMFGFALGTTAVWAIFDAEWFAPAGGEKGNSSDVYRTWAWSFARKLYTVSMLWTAAAGSWYVFGAWSPELRRTMFEWPLLPLTVATAIAPGACWVLLLIAGRFRAKRFATAAVLLGQLGVLGINAASRQVVQNLDTQPYFNVLAQATDIQWGPLTMFLVTFVIGLAVIVWMIAQVRKCATK